MSDVIRINIIIFGTSLSFGESTTRDGRRENHEMIKILTETVKMTKTSRQYLNEQTHGEYIRNRKE